MPSTIPYDLVRVVINTTGPGSPLTLGAAVEGARSFEDAAVPNGALISYGLLDTDSGHREVARGIYNSSNGTITRATIASSTGSALDLGGVSELMIDFIAIDFDFADFTEEADIGNVAWIPVYAGGKRKISKANFFSGIEAALAAAIEDLEDLIDGIPEYSGDLELIDGADFVVGNTELNILDIPQDYRRLIFKWFRTKHNSGTPTRPRLNLSTDNLSTNIGSGQIISARSINTGGTPAFAPSTTLTSFIECGSGLNITSQSTQWCDGIFVMDGYRAGEEFSFFAIPTITVSSASPTASGRVDGAIILDGQLSINSMEFGWVGGGAQFQTSTPTGRWELWGAI